MRWIKRGIRGKNVNVLDVSSIENEEIHWIVEKGNNVYAVQMQLDEMHLLPFFPNVQLLILTGGMPDDNDFSALYSNDKLRELVLDYEETDSDEDGIRIDLFPNLDYVLSRSNLNICSSNIISNSSKIDILNYYKNGRPKKITIPASIDICRPKTGIFFSTEAQTPAAELLVYLLREIDSYLLENGYMISRYTNELDEIGIIPICMSKEMIDHGFYKERKYVNKKKRYADLRLHLDYECFVEGPESKRREMCYDNIKAAGEYISSKTSSFDIQQFLNDVRTAIHIS